MTKKRKTCGQCGEPFSGKYRECSDCRAKKKAKKAAGEDSSAVAVGREFLDSLEALKEPEKIRVYRVSFDGMGYCVDSPRAVAEFLETELTAADDWAAGNSWEVTIGTMTREEFESLPEFNGF